MAPTPAPFDAYRHRADFPALDQQVNGHRLVYLDNGATAHKPLAVIEAVRRFYAEGNSNIHRGVHTLSQRATDAYEAAREALARYINAPSSRQVVFTRGTTEAVNLVAHSFGRRLREGDEVVVTTMEHHSNIVPWQLACEAAGARLRVVPIDERGVIDYDAYLGLLTDRTRLVAAVHVSNALGTVNPVERMIRDAHAKGIPVLLDGAQAMAHGRVDVQALDVDFYCLSGHKMFGPTGVGALYGRAELLEEMPPWQGGGDMIERVSFDGTTYDDLPHKFEAGTPNIAGGIGLGAAVEYLESLDWDGLVRHEHDLLQYATERLATVEGLRVVGTAPEKASVVSFVLDGIHPYDAGNLLDRRGIAVRTGHHCTQPLMQRLGLEGTIRASMAFYNTREDVDALVEALHAVRAEMDRKPTADVPAGLAGDGAAPEATVEVRMAEIEEAFELLDDLDMRRDFVMDLGKSLPAMDESVRTEKYRVHGCQSLVWVYPELHDGRVHFQGDSNAMITKGLVGLLLHLLDRQPPEAILEADLDAFLERIGMQQLISQNRKNGLAAMIKQIRLYALVFAKQLAAASA